MKRISLILLVAFILCSCGSVSSFESPNSFRNINGTLFLRNGKSIEGRLVVQVGNVFSSDVKIYEEEDKKPMNYSLDEVMGYRIRSDYYFLKEKKGGLGLGRRLSFMKRLTPEDSRIHLYEDMEKVSETNKANGVTNTRTRYEREYYLQLPSDENSDDVYPLGGSRFVPNFDEKMSRIVGDCPSLAQKIASKSDGYFYAQVSLFKEKRVNVLMNIIGEYNRCR